MKPILLHLKNIGPFRDETIDFSQLGDMFLICGKTGAGKSTIFNAITYALYGKLSGSHSQIKGNQIRSDFAAENEEASITLIFLHRDSCYKIERILPSIHLNKKNTVTKQSETIQLLKKEGSEFQLISNQKSEADSIIESVLGLTVEEFSRIILLPQGEFAAFLRQNSNGKRETLLKLFPLDGYENIIKVIKEKSDSEKNKLAAVEQQLISFGEYNPQEQEKLILSFDEVLSTNEKKQKTLNDNLNKLRQNIDNTKNLIQDFIRHDELERKLSDHLQFEKEIMQKEKQINLAIKATPAYLKIKDWERTNTIYLDIKQQLEITKSNIDQIKKTEENLKSQENYYFLQKEKYEKNTKLQHDIKNGIILQKESDEIILQKEKLTKVRDDLIKSIHETQLKEDEIKENLHNLSSLSTDLLQDLSKQIIDVEKKLSILEINLKEASYYQILEEEIRVKEKKIQDLILDTNKIKDRIDAERQIYDLKKEKSYARELVLRLKDGEPCPVCGSTEHPTHTFPDQSNGNTSTIDLEEKKQLIQKLESEWNEIFSNLSKEEGSLKALKQQKNQLTVIKTIEEIQEEINLNSNKKNSLMIHQNKLNEDFALKNKLEKELIFLQESKSPIENEVEEINQSLAKLAGSINEKEQMINKYFKDAHTAGFIGDTINLVSNKIDSWILQTSNFINEYEHKIKQIEQNLNSEITRSLEQEKNLAIQKNELNIAETEMTRFLNDAQFTSKIDVENAYLTQSTIEDFKSKINYWTETRVEYETQCKEIKNKLTGTLEENELLLTELEKNKLELENEIDLMSQKYKTALQESEKIKSQLHNWNTLETERKKIQSVEKLYTQLYIHISDKNLKKTAITTWILGVYLDLVVSCANSRLRRISEGRYTLDFQKEKTGNGAKGLDLEILDSYTGKRRSCSTLSGGETFLVSISLALALTDVVTSKRGGISLQSLFIDEGFGSLDPASLERALSILEEVREGRCVGVISHVSEMKNRIPSRLEVVKSSTGSNIKHTIEM